jgi:ABC-type spermidine/putrescine transport system permease subunit II
MSTRATRSSGWQLASLLYAALFFVFLYVPILALVLLSFNDSAVMGFPLRGFSFNAYNDALADGALVQALWNSFQIAIVSAAAGTTLAMLALLGMRHCARLAPSIMIIVVLPIVVPGIVTGVVLLIFFGLLGVDYGLWPATFIVHVTWVLPFAFLTLYPTLHGFDRSVEEAAMDLGARPIVVLYRIVFPLIRPALLATFLFAFTVSFDEFVRTFFVIGTQQTTPVHLWILVTEQVAPFLPAVGVIIMLVTLTAAGTGFWFSARRATSPSQAQRSIR